MAKGHSADFASSGFSARGVTIAGSLLGDSSLVDWLVRKKEFAFRLRLFCWIGGDDDVLVLSLSVPPVGSATYICVGCRQG